MRRRIDESLQSWSRDPERRVLLVRGARQVGKTWSVRHLGRRFVNVAEINFEEDREAGALFAGSLEPRRLVAALSAYLDVPIAAGRTLLFLDEIQACPDALRALRFLYEKLPELHVAAAGSLVEFALRDLPSHGVGRVQSLFMYPMTFEEHLWAQGADELAEAIGDAVATGRGLVEPLHLRALELLKSHLLVGGMPAVVRCHCEQGDLRRGLHMLDSLLQSFLDDFAKYATRLDPAHLRSTFLSVALQAGGKFSYSRVSRECPSRTFRAALEVLERARVAHRVVHSAARGLPLGAQENPRLFKVLPFDVGLYGRMVGLDLPAYLVETPTAAIHRGALAEVAVGLELIAAGPPEQAPGLHYWHREARSASAEVDYVVAQGGHPVPVEVKAGVRGRMRSLHAFLAERGGGTAVRVSSENFGRVDDVEVVPAYGVGWRFRQP